MLLTLGFVPEGLATTLPYSTRTKSYSGWTPGVFSDTDTTGMAGATVALPYSVSAGQWNPAGYSMETASVSAQIVGMSVDDKRLQPDGQAISASQWGFGLSPAPWGFAISYYSPITENAIYESPNTGDFLNTETSLKEFRLTASRLFFDERLAVGASFELAKAVREIGPYSFNSFAPSYQLGGLYRLQDRVIIGVSYTPPLTIGAASSPVSQNEMPGFNQPYLRPSEIALGVGWIPNRFFKLGASVSYVGDTFNTALLADQNTVTGASPTLVPRVGAFYTLAQFKNFESDMDLGTYYETSRLSGESSRPHVTWGWDVNPYFVNLGIGFDLSSGYRNFMFGVGVDIVRTARLLKLIPDDPTPPLGGFFPTAFQVSPDGLAEPLTHGEEKKSAPLDVGDVKKIVEDVPANIGQRLNDLSNAVEKGINAAKKQAVIQPGPSPTPKKVKKKKRPKPLASPSPGPTESAPRERATPTPTASP